MIALLHRRHARVEQSPANRDEAKYQAMVEQVPAVAYTWDPAHEPGTVPATYISPQIERLLGFTTQQWIEDPELWGRQVHDGDLDRVLSAWHEEVEAGDRFSVEYRIHTATGEDCGSATRQARLTVGTGRDTAGCSTTSRRSMKHSRRSARWRSASDDSSSRRRASPTSRTRRPRRPSYISPQVEDVYGYTSEEWMADAGLWARSLHPDDRAWVVADNAADTGDVWSVDYRSVTRDGHTIWVHNEAVLIRDECGAPLFWQGLVLDITQRKEAEARLREAEERYRRLVEQLPAVVYIDAVDELATARYVGPQYERLTGYTPAERMADPAMWMRMIHPDDRERVVAESIRTNETEEAYDIEHRTVVRRTVAPCGCTTTPSWSVRPMATTCGRACSPTSPIASSPRTP